MKTTSVTLFDGQRSEARLFRASSPGPGLLVLPAMGVNARAYDRLAESLAELGVTTLVAEHRGGDGSSVRARRGVDFGYAELLRDVVAHRDVLRDVQPTPVSVLGHSLGGQLGTVGFASWQLPGSKLVVIAAGTVHHTAWSGVERLGVFVGTQAAGGVARALGYFPGHRLGFGGLQSRSLIVDWAHAAKTGTFRVERELDAHSPEVLAIEVRGDTMAPRRATELLVAKLPRAKVEWLVLEPPAQPRKMNPHFRWLKDPSVVAQRVATFLIS